MITVYHNRKSGMMLSRNSATGKWIMHFERGSVPLTARGAHLALQEHCGTDWAGNPNWLVYTMPGEPVQTCRK